MESTTKKFQWKYALSWLMMGAVAALILVISMQMPKEIDLVGKFGMFLAISLVPPIYGFLGMFFDAWFSHKWHFNEIEHSPLIWHIYPIVALVHLVFAFFIGIAIAAWPFKGK